MKTSIFLYIILLLSSTSLKTNCQVEESIVQSHCDHNECAKLYNEPDEPLLVAEAESNDNEQISSSENTNPPMW